MIGLIIAGLPVGLMEAEIKQMQTPAQAVGEYQQTQNGIQNGQVGHLRITMVLMQVL